MRLYKSVLHGILIDPFYYGMMNWGGLTGKGKHEPLISKQLWERVQDVLHGKARAHPVRHDFTYRGMMRCGQCGCTITAQYAKKTYI